MEKKGTRHATLDMAEAAEKVEPAKEETEKSENWNADIFSLNKVKYCYSQSTHQLMISGNHPPVVALVLVWLRQLNHFFLWLFQLRQFLSFDAHRAGKCYTSAKYWFNCAWQDKYFPGWFNPVSLGIKWKNHLYPQDVIK